MDCAKNDLHNILVIKSQNHNIGDSVMSHTIRVSDELYGAIDDYRKKDQSFQDVVEEMAEEIGLLPARIQDADDLQNKLQNLYGFNSEETSRVLKALRIIYIGQEDEGTIGLPHETIDSEYANEIDALKRLKLVREKIKKLPH